MSPLRKVLDGLASVRLAIGLIVALAAGSMLATFIPQGLEADAYTTLYPAPLAWILVESGLTRFFGSLPFLTLAFLFLANLSTCAVRRFLRELGRQGSRRFGPDLLHLGLIALMVASIWSSTARREGMAMLFPGDEVLLPDGTTLGLEEFRFETYEDGRPKDWVSTLSLTKEGKPLREHFPLRVNSPLRHAGLSLYQASYESAWALALESPDGALLILREGEQKTFGDRSYLFLHPERPGDPLPGKAVVGVSGEASTFLAGPGDPVGDLKARAMRLEYGSGIQLVVDPAYPLVFAALLLVALGSAWTFLQKLREGV